MEVLPSIQRRWFNGFILARMRLARQETFFLPSKDFISQTKSPSQVVVITADLTSGDLRPCFSS